MAVPCNECETPEFCIRVARCLNHVLEDHYGETGMQDQEDLTAEEVDINMPDFEEDVFNTPLAKRERSIISRAIKGF